MIAQLLLAALIGGTAYAPIIDSHYVKYCSGYDAYKFDIDIDTAWDFDTVDEYGRRALTFAFNVGTDPNDLKFQIYPTDPNTPLAVDMHEGFGTPPLISVPIPFLDMEGGELAFEIPAYMFGKQGGGQLYYGVHIFVYGATADSELGWSIPGGTCVVANETVTWGHVKALYR